MQEGVRRPSTASKTVQGSSPLARTRHRHQAGAPWLSHRRHRPAPPRQPDRHSFSPRPPITPTPSARSPSHPPSTRPLFLAYPLFLCSPPASTLPPHPVHTLANFMIPPAPDDGVATVIDRVWSPARVTGVQCRVCAGFVQCRVCARRRPHARHGGAVAAGRRGIVSF
jgi:hypothetical protein